MCARVCGRWLATPAPKCCLQRSQKEITRFQRLRPAALIRSISASSASIAAGSSAAGSAWEYASADRPSGANWKVCDVFCRLAEEWGMPRDEPRRLDGALAGQRSDLQPAIIRSNKGQFAQPVDVDHVIVSPEFSNSARAPGSGRQPGFWRRRHAPQASRWLRRGNLAQDIQKVWLHQTAD